MALGDLYILTPHGPARAHDFNSWTRWMAKHKRRTTIRSDRYDAAHILTDFTGVDMATADETGPFIFRVRISGGHLDGYSRLFTNEVDAVKCHKRLARKVRRHVYPQLQLIPMVLIALLVAAAAVLFFLDATAPM